MGSFQGNAGRPTGEELGTTAHQDELGPAAGLREELGVAREVGPGAGTFLSLIADQAREAFGAEAVEGGVVLAQ